MISRLSSIAFALGTLGLVVLACGDDPASPAGAASSGAPSGGDGGVLPDGGRPPPVRAEFGLDARPANATCKAFARPPTTAAVTWEPVFTNVNLSSPMMLAQAPGDRSRWFAALRGGQLVSFPTTNPPDNPTVVGTLTNVQLGGEAGFLGFAFHPRYAENGRVYVTWIRNAGGGVAAYHSEVGTLRTTNNGTTFGEYAPILEFDQQPATNHKGGGIGFGKDGFLYLSFGDGGGGGDTYNQGQTKNGFFSKVLRIDVDTTTGGRNYGIPDGNPFKSGGGEAAVFAYGFRNPFRLSIDRESGEVWVGDVGQNEWEEIDRVQAGGNYGWPCREGAHDHRDCPGVTGLAEPVGELTHAPGTNTRSLTGGVVYHGKAIPALAGAYIFGDHKKQELWAMSTDPTSGQVAMTRLNPSGPSNNWVHFAEDLDGEVYAVALSGDVYKMVPNGGGGGASAVPESLSKTGCFDSADPKKPAPGLIGFGVNAALWSDGAEKERHMALPDGQKITVGADGDFELPNGTVLTKTFLLEGKRVETRLLVRHDDGVWAGYSYEWNDAETDATLLPAGKTRTVGGKTWTYPSRSDCVRCHTEAAGRSLGLELGQQNGDYVYASTNRIANQLATLDHIGMFAGPLPAIRAAYPSPSGTQPVEGRARAYLHANCSNCHRPEGGGGGNLDLRFATTFANTRSCNVDGDRGDLGVAGAKLLAPGAPDKSLLSLRPHASGANRMPPLGTTVVDSAGLQVVDDWIRSVAACPP